MSTYYRDKQLAKIKKEAQAFRTRADINAAYVHLKVELLKLQEATDNDKEPEHFINSDLTALVVELGQTISNMGVRNANLQNENKELASIIIAKQNKLDYYEHK